MSPSLSPPQFLRKMGALVALTLVSLYVGFIMKKNQYNRVYPYSPLSVAVVTEFFKMMCSILMLTTMAQFESRSLGVTSFRYWTNLLKENVTRQLLLSEFRLALMYTLLNIAMTHIFFFVSGSTFFTIKTMAPLMTGLFLHYFVRRSVSIMQWATLVAQCVAFLMTQLNFCNNCTDENIIIWITVVIVIGISSVAGVYNEHLAKTGGTNLNVQNVILFGFGVLLNYLVYLLTPTYYLGLASDLGFFENWDYGVITVIIANGSIELVITAVYKYGDVLIKFFALACSSSVLFYLEARGVLLRSSRGTGPMTPLLSALVIFYAGYIYASLPSAPITATTTKRAKDDRDTPEESITVAADYRKGDDFVDRHYSASYDASINLLLSSKPVILLYLLTLTNIALALSGYETCDVSCM